jgi:hypothetical protein
VDEGTGRQRCRDLQLDYARNAVFDGAVVKSNGPANREIRHFIRNPDTGLLEDRSVDIRSLAMSSAVRERITHVVDFVRMRENDGRAVTQGGTNDGLYNAVHESVLTEPCVIAIKNGGKESTIKGTIIQALEMGLIRKYALSLGGSEKWLGTMDGPFSRGEYERQTGRDNI